MRELDWEKIIIRLRLHRIPEEGRFLSDETMKSTNN